MLPPAVQVGLDRARRRSETLGDVGHRALHPVVKVDRGPVGLVQRVQAIKHGTVAPSFLRGFLGIGLPRRRGHGVQHLFPLVGNTEPGLPLSLDSQVVGDAVEPGGKTAIPPEGMAGLNPAIMEILL